MVLTRLIGEKNGMGKKKVIKAICFVLIFGLLNEGIRFISTDDTNSYTRVMMHELYSSTENIDILFLGASHCFKALDPRITDKFFEANTFNAGSSSQPADGSLALLKETIKDNQIKEVYIEVGYGMAGYEPDCFWDRTDLTGTYIISNYMKPSFNKFRYLLHASGPDYYGNSFFVARQNWENLLLPMKMLEILSKKSSKAYWGYSYPVNGTQKYSGKGYVEDSLEIPLGGMYSTEDYQKIEDSVWSADWQESIREIIEFCEKENISLTFFSASVPDFLLVASGDYDLWIDFMNSLVKGTSAKYYDFNLCKPEYLNLEDDCFKDDNHMNSKGAKIFSTFFSEFFTGKLAEEDIFYDTYREKIEKMEDKVFGLIVKDNKDAHSISIEPVTNAGITDIQYTAVQTSKKSKRRVSEHKAEESLVYEAGEVGEVELRVYLNGKETNHISVPYGGQ